MTPAKKTPPGVEGLTAQIQAFLAAGGSVDDLSRAIAQAITTITPTAPPSRETSKSSRKSSRKTPPTRPETPPRTGKYSQNQKRFVKQWRQDLKAWKEQGLSARQAKARMRDLIASGKTTRKGIRDSDFFKAWKLYEPKLPPREEEPPRRGGAGGVTPPPGVIDVPGPGEQDLGYYPPEEPEEEEEPIEVSNIVMYGMVIKGNGEYAYITEGNYFVKGQIDYPEIHDHLKRHDMRMIRQGLQDRIFIGIQYYKESEFSRRQPYSDLIEQKDFLNKVVSDLNDLVWYQRGERKKARGDREIRRVRSPLRDEYEARIRGETYQTTLGGDE